MCRKPRVIYRAMKEDLDGKPLVGRSGRTLGVRICGQYADIEMINCKIRPYTGGMSVTPDSVGRLPKSKLPRSLGGEGRDPIFSFNVDDLPSSLVLRRDRPTHGLVEPSMCCLFRDYERKLHGTREDWTKSHE